MLYAHRSFRWDVRTLLLAAFASVPPFFTLVFEVWADRRGLLGTVGSSSKKTVTVAS